MLWKIKLGFSTAGNSQLCEKFNYFSNLSSVWNNETNQEFALIEFWCHICW